MEEELLQYGGKDAGVLKRFMQEFFPYREFNKIGFFTKEMKGNYYLQAKRVCLFLGYKTVFEYRSKEVVCHVSVPSKMIKKDDKFLTILPSIYD